MNMVKDKYDTSRSVCEEWTDLVDRDGLWHVQENMYSFFLSLEEETCMLLPSLLTKGKEKSELVRSLCAVKMFSFIC